MSGAHLLPALAGAVPYLPLLTVALEKAWLNLGNVQQIVYFPSLAAEGWGQDRDSALLPLLQERRRPRICGPPSFPGKGEGLKPSNERIGYPIV